MKPHVVIAADQIGDAQVQRIVAALESWATYERVADDSSEIREAVRRADILVGWGEPQDIRDGRVRTYLCGSVGYDEYVGQGLHAKPGFRFTTAARTMSIPIAEHCIAMMLTLVREVNTIIRQQIERRWERRWRAGEMTGKKACIVGLGGSGTELAVRLAALGLRLCGVRRDVSRGHQIVSQVYAPQNLDLAVADADHIFCVVPGGASTLHLFNAQIFQSMKRGAFFYSASRGSATDERALVNALRSGVLAGAGIDVFENEPLPKESALWDMENVIVSPHSAGHSLYMPGRLADLFIENLHNLLDDRPLRNEIDVKLLR